MKHVWLALLLSHLAAPVALLQTATQPGPGLLVLDVKWIKIHRDPRLEIDPLSANDQSTAQRRAQEDALKDNIGRTKSELPLTQIPQRGGQQSGESSSAGPRVSYEYRVTVKNTGAKEIRRVFWHYESYDATLKQFVGRRDYETPIKIRPGETKKLVVNSVSPPSRTTTASAKDQQTSRVVLKRIEYADGTLWQRH